jgi:hypothetical protein
MARAVKGIFSDVADYSTALTRGLFMRKTGRLVIKRFIEAGEDRVNLYHWLEAHRTVRTEGGKPLYEIRQRTMVTSNAPLELVHETTSNNKERVSVDDKTLFTLEEAVKVLSSWEQEAKENYDICQIDPKQPLKGLHFGRHSQP